jgi:DnaJ domain
MRIVLESGAIYEIENDYSLRILTKNQVFPSSAHVWHDAGNRWISIADYLRSPPPLPGREEPNGSHSGFAFPEIHITCSDCDTTLRVTLQPFRQRVQCPFCRTIIGDLEVKAKSMVFSPLKPPNTTANHEEILSRDQARRVLGVADHASGEEITKAFRRKLHECHPDRVHGLCKELQDLATSLSKRVNQAYGFLTRK